MVEQLALLGGPRTITTDGRALTPLQQTVYDQIRASHNGLDAAETGAILHAHRPTRPHAVDERCLYCSTDGAAFLRAPVFKTLLVRRRSGMWQPRRREHWLLEGRDDGAGLTGRRPGANRSAPSRPSSGQLRGLPGVSFGDIFGDAA